MTQEAIWKLSATAIVAGILVIPLAACSSSTTVTVVSPGPTTSTFSPSPLPTANGTVDSSSSSAPPEPDLGATRDNPVPVGQTGTFKTWGVKVVGYTPNADDSIHQANSFNHQPKPGYHYVMVEVKTANIGKKSSDPYFDLAFKCIDNTGQQYGEPEVVLPNDLIDAGNVPPGSFVQGNVACQVKDTSKALVLYIEDSSSYSVTVTGFMALF
jgi:hypothetical protein